MNIFHQFYHGGEIFTSEHQCDTAQSDTESEQINVAGAEEVNGDGSKPCPCVTCGNLQG